MCRTKTPNIDPFNPFRADLAPEVMSMISGLRQAQRNGREPLPEYIRLLMPSRRTALVAVAFRHLSIEEGGEAIDVHRRVRGRNVPPLMKRVARRLHTTVDRVRALCSLLMVPRLPACAWETIDQGFPAERMWSVVKQLDPNELDVDLPSALIEATADWVMASPRNRLSWPRRRHLRLVA